MWKVYFFLDTPYPIAKAAKSITPPSTGNPGGVPPGGGGGV